MDNSGENIEQAIESVPSWLKSSYIYAMHTLKKILNATGLLEKLDNHAQQNQKFHYLRSLLGIYQLEDMVALDVPWWTYAAIVAIDKHLQLNPQFSVFEYGSGASTIWLAKRAKHVISIEHDKQWHEQLRSKISGFNNIELLLKLPEIYQDSEIRYRSAKVKNCHFKEYVTAIDQFDQLFDVIIIDGRCREACLQTCLLHLSPNGIIIFDNSNRKRYQQAILHSGLTVERFYGRVPGSPFKSETAILKRS